MKNFIAVRTVGVSEDIIWGALSIAHTARVRQD
jgi:hypothetical protein